MDPDAVLNDLITNIMNGELGEAQEDLKALRKWRDRDGFPPQDPRPGIPQRPGIDWRSPRPTTTTASDA